MKLETILDAMRFANDRYVHNPEMAIRRDRQYRAFRARILRVDTKLANAQITIDSWVTTSKHQDEWIDQLRVEIKEKDVDIQELGTALDMVLADVEEQTNEIEKKDAKIDKLMELAVVVDRLRKQRMNTDYMDAMDMAKEILK